MKKQSASRSAFFNLRALCAFLLCLIGGVLGFAASGAPEVGSSATKLDPTATTPEIVLTSATADSAASSSETEQVSTTPNNHPILATTGASQAPCSSGSRP
jgi:hypothetical protein